MLFIFALLLFSDPAHARDFTYCVGRGRHTCVVDGDTLWLDGVKHRLKGYDTPEPLVHVCGGRKERKLAKRASSRLIELLNTKPWKIKTVGKGSLGRALSILTIQGRDVGDILIEEGLARKWPDGHEFWCD